MFRKLVSVLILERRVYTLDSKIKIFKDYGKFE